MREKIFVSAYACEPGLGSEIGVGWHWVLEMSKTFDLWVLTRESNRETIEGWLKENELENCPNFLYYDLPKKWRFWKKGLRGVQLYYVLWQKLTNKLVKQCMEENGIEIYHLLTYGNGLWPVSDYGRKKTFIWGPTSVGNDVPKEFIKHYKGKDKLKETLQSIVAGRLKSNKGFTSRCSDADLILCKTERTRLSVPEKDRHKAVVFTDVAVEMMDTSKYVSKQYKDNITRYLAVGRLEGWRGFDLLIEAMAKAVKLNKNLHLDILGKGSDRERLSALIARRGVGEYVSLVGQVSMEEYYQYMANCDVVVNPALKEGAVTTAFDSMSFAKPLLCIDTGGYSRYFNNDYAVVIPFGTRDEIINSLKDGISLLSDSKVREEKVERLKEVRKSFTWEEKGLKIAEAIFKVVQK